MYIEQAKSKVAQYTDVSNFVISIHVYAETYNGPGKLVFVGITKENKRVRWVKNIAIDKTITNSAKVRFYNDPSLEIRPLLYPVVDLNLASEEDIAATYKQAFATATINGFVTNVFPITPGSGYTSTPIVVIDSPTSGTKATAIANVVGGSVTSYTITNQGSGYASNPNVTLSGGGFTVAATAASDITTPVTEFVVTFGGAGYKVEHPTVTIPAGSGGGAGAIGKANVIGGVVESIDIVSGGDGYSSIPTVIIEDPTPTTAADLNVPITFGCNFYGYAVNPLADTNRSLVNKKRTEIDYRIVATDIENKNTLPALSQTGSFNVQMEGRSIDFTITKIKTPLSQREISVNLSQTFKVKKVLDPKTMVVSDPFYYKVGNSEFVANIIQGELSIDYNFIKYNTSPDSSLTIVPTSTSDPVQVKESYVEATYRNIKTFSGFVARHKLYRRSMFYPGEFQLISDEPLNSVELLTDTVTFNRAYYEMGKFYHQFHINKYWFTSSKDDMYLTASSFPINSMYMYCGLPELVDGSKYAMVKTDTIGGTNDNIYYPYNENEFNQLSGSSYNSNFINLKKDSLHALYANLVIEKNKDDLSAKVGFYFTSSISSIKEEKEYDPRYGWKLGEVAVTEKTIKKYFKEPQKMFFTPTDDYYGTLKIVPYHCNITVSDLSMKAYGDSGFSPEVLVIRVPCPLNVTNEAFEFKAELYDIDSVLIPTDLGVAEAFDPTGISLYGKDQLGQAVYITNNGNTIISTTEQFTINGELYLPNIDPNCSPTDYNRLVTWNGINGKLERTSIIDVYHDDEYITLRTGSCNSFLITPIEGKSVAVTFDGLNGGRQIYWVDGITKQIDSSI